MKSNKTAGLDGLTGMSIQEPMVPP